MLRASNRPILAYFDSIKNLRLRQLSLILKAGYDPNLMVNSRGQNGLQYMINYFGATDAHFRLQAPINRAAYLSIAKLLLDSGLDPNTIDLLTGETVMFDAIRFNDKEMVSLLLNYVDLSVRNKNGETALMCAARFGSKQVMRMLLEHLRHLEMDGYFLRQRNRFGLTALELARAENLECAKVLTKHLIAFGHHTSAVLARSSSHHQLLQRAAHLQPYARIAAGYRSPASAAAVAAAAAGALCLSGDVDSASDYDSDVLDSVGPANLRGGHLTGASGGGGGAGGARPSVSGGGGGGGGGGSSGYNRGGFFDSNKAAEFNQYLLEQQQDFAAAAADQPQHAATLSDDEEAGGYFGGSGGGLTRSRSCMLGPASSGSKQQQQQQQQVRSSSNKKDSPAGKMGPANWGDGGRGTIG